VIQAARDGRDDLAKAAATLRSRPELTEAGDTAIGTGGDIRHGRD
jgi:hypothetical protein